MERELNKMEEFLVEMGQPRFRAKQVFGWLYKGVSTFDEMTNVPAALREKLAQESEIGLPEILRVQQSKIDGTRKYLFGLKDGNAIESVFMKYKI